MKTVAKAEPVNANFEMRIAVSDAFRIILGGTDLPVFVIGLLRCIHSK